MNRPAALLGWFVLLTAVVSSCAATPPQAAWVDHPMIDKVWLHVDGDWISSPPDLDALSIRSAPATLLRLSKTHEFSMVQGWIVENQKKLSISPGDPHRVYVGEWKANDSKVDISYRLVYELVQSVDGGKYPRSEQKDSIEVVSNSIRLAGAMYLEAAVDPKEYERFIAPEREKLRTTN